MASAVPDQYQLGGHDLAAFRCLLLPDDYQVPIGDRQAFSDGIWSVRQELIVGSRVRRVLLSVSAVRSNSQVTPHVLSLMEEAMTAAGRPGHGAGAGSRSEHGVPAARVTAASGPT